MSFQARSTPLLLASSSSSNADRGNIFTVSTKDVILRGVYQATQAILDHVAADETADGIFRIISGRINTLKSDLNQKVTELLEPHYNGHPITYNHYLTDNVQKAQSDRR